MLILSFRNFNVHSVLKETRPIVPWLVPEHRKGKYAYLTGCKHGQSRQQWENRKLSCDYCIHKKAFERLLDLIAQQFA